MDIFSHGLWAMLYAKYYNQDYAKKLKLNVWLAGFWGMFPDLLAFSPSFIWRFLSPAADLYTLYSSNDLISQLTRTLYNIGHSMVIFAIVVLVILAVRGFSKKNLPWILGGWFLHILADIPTHTHKFFPTPFLWPLSTWTFSGFSWGQLWFLVLDYGMIVVVYLMLRKLERDSKAITTRKFKNNGL